ncbi:Bifunctional nuclease 2 [Acorus calamus]|uniref:Bifunctional nuclease 2 n=1 Tax=Acorus calamus TaxID=4465 RepID=A0AAV9DR59_ACOCL|nr:Bifunctional nuclease 2 [Acorus calamus]
MLRVQIRLSLASNPGPSSYPSSSSDPPSIVGISFSRRANLSSSSRLTIGVKRRVNPRPSFVVSCDASRRGGCPADRADDEFFEAFVLVPETVMHYNLRKQGFVEETKWSSSSQNKGSKSDINSIGHGFLRKFQSPTIFLKIACDGDVVLPIIVGEHAIDRLIEALMDDELDEHYPNQFQFVKNLVETLGYEVKMVCITERVVNTYHARIVLGKPTEDTTLTVDARPSDAINVAKRCKAPIYVSKNIVSKDAIKIVYGRWKGKNAKSVYDVSLDSAVEGPDPLAEELDLVRKLNMAIGQEKYEDAAKWRDKINKLRTSR